MNPNFEDLSCDMIFGQVPPPIETDPALSQPCFKIHCALKPEDGPLPACTKLVDHAAVARAQAAARRENRVAADVWGRE